MVSVVTTKWMAESWARGVADRAPAFVFRAAIIFCPALLLPGCGKSQETKVVRAIEAAYPNGHRRCLNLAGASVGIHVAAGFAETLWLPSTGVTSPINHAFVFWASRADAQVPELVADLAERGIIKKATVDATVDAEGSQLGPQAISPQGIYYHPTIYRHRTMSFPVDIYTTKAFDDGFNYALQTQAGPNFAQPVSFPSRLYDTPLPPSDQHYLVPTTTPYAVSVVTSACFLETLDGVDAIRDKVNFLGARTLEADVRFGQHPPDWMLTPAFGRAAIGPDTPSITRPRHATVVLKVEGDTLSYLSEESR